MLAVVGQDFLELFTALISDPARFQRSARLFDLFAYDRARELTPENIAHVSRWVRFTTELTRCEAPLLLDQADLSAAMHMLDVGGNSGEFAVQACRRYPALRATVLDLPVVCHLGERHVARTPEAPRIDLSFPQWRVGKTSRLFTDLICRIRFGERTFNATERTKHGTLRTGLRGDRSDGALRRERLSPHERTGVFFRTGFMHPSRPRAAPGPAWIPA